MKPERWQRIKEVAFAAMEMGEDQRGEFLAKECGSDSELRRAAEALVDEDQRSGATIECGIASAAADVQHKRATTDRDTMLGRSISHYKITEKLGEGGMGVVYKAEDAKLKRSVALKFLPVNELGGEVERARFLREAQAAAALNHPNICTIYEIDESQGRTFIAMEYVDGQTVKEKIASRPQPLKEALEIAIQAAQGLKAAHQKEIVHRDIKPANLMLTEEGQVKVMDFGLAQPGDATRLTKTGGTLGTIAYMPPEQAQGKEVDNRADVWSLGVVIYEMVTGQLPFKGEHNQLVANNIQNAEPEPMTALRAGVPMELEWIVGKALAKDRAERYQQVEELIVDLRGLNKKLAAGTSTIVPIPPAVVPRAPSEVVVPKRKLRLQQALLAATALVLLAVAMLHLREISSKIPLRKFSFTAPVPEHTHAGVSISPNGRYVAVTAMGGLGKLWVKDLESEHLRAIEDTDGARGPFWSPGSDFIGFVNHRKLQKVAVQGGAVTRVRQLPNHLFVGTWSPDGESMVLSGWNPPGLYEVPARGGPLRPLISSQELEIRAEPGAISQAQFLPGAGRVLLFAAGPSASHNMMVQDLDTGRRETLGPGTNPVYSPSGHIVYQPPPSREELWALPFSTATLKATGEPFPIAQNARWPTVADDGTLAYLDVGDVSSPRRLVWLNRSGQKTGEVGEVQHWTSGVALSPDEGLVAVSAKQGADQDLWVWDRATEIGQKVVSSTGTDMLPIWSPDGEKLAYTSLREGSFQILLRQADGSGQEELLVKDGFLTDWSRDGKYLLYEVFSPGQVDLWYLERKEDGSGWESHPFLTALPHNRAGKFSPDSRYVAYLEFESSVPSTHGGQEPYEVYVQLFPGGGQKTKVSTNGGRQVRWSRDGTELFFVRDGALMAAPVRKTPNFSVDRAESLFENTSLALGAWIAQYDVAADGQKFIQAVGSGESTIRVVQNWYEEFRDRE